MNHQDEAIDKALAAIGQASVPEGMEARILRRIEAQPAVRTTRRLGAQRLLPASGICLACLVLAIAALSRRGTSPPVFIAAPASPQITHQPGTILLPVTAQPHPRHISHPPTPIQASPQSFPAPPAPLTEQEKLLVRFAQARHAAIPGRTDNARNQSPPTPASPSTQAPLTHEETLLVAVSRIHQPAILDALDERRRAEIDAKQKHDFAAYAAQKDGGS